MKTALIWGATPSAKSDIEEIEKNYEIIGFIDNNTQKIGGEIFEKKIYSSDYLKDSQNLFDIIFILSISGCESIVKQLKEMGIPNSKINSDFVKLKVYPRISFLKNLSELFLEKGIKGATAEVGVFQGDFAKYINKYFSKGNLYLFDTFEGFNQQDIIYEEKYNLSKSVEGHLSNTSIDLVLSKMKHQDKVKIVKGYFPESTQDFNVDEKFAFVNLDVDLYKPTYEALVYFSEKLVDQGIILIHDYFNNGYLGVKKAVNQFLDSHSNFCSFPIGDSCSIAIIKNSDDVY